MLQLVRDFQEHPQSVGETYLQHWRTAIGFALTLLGCGLMCLVHAFVPGLFKHSASRCLCDLHQRMVESRNRKRAD